MGASLNHFNHLPPLTIHFTVGDSRIKELRPSFLLSHSLSNALSLESELVNLF